MANTEKTPSVWQALDGWGKTLKPWQRCALAYAIKGRLLSEAQIQEVYARFLEEAGLRDKQERGEVAVDVSGRPAEAATKSVRLEQIDGLSGVNAIPDGASMRFGPALTVIYGRNGAGKSGFARLFANACFSRHKPKIIGNIYEKKVEELPKANFHVSIDGAPQQPLAFSTGIEHAELKRISFFDTTVARHHVTESAAFEFKPAGFDVFPEMARVYARIGEHLDADMRSKQHDTNFSDSFIGDETEVSKAVTAIGASTNLAALRKLGTYSPSDAARLPEVDKQLTALKSKSPKDLIAQLKQAKEDIAQLSQRLTKLGEMFTPARVATRNELAVRAKAATDTATAVGSEQFKRPFFRAIGSPEWEAFAKAAHGLARKEGEGYPADDARCLLCERPFDESSKKHVGALLGFVQGDAQREAKKASDAVTAELSALEKLDVNVFAAEGRVHEHVLRLDPAIERIISESTAKLADTRTAATEALRSRTTVQSTAEVDPSVKSLSGLIERIEADIQRLEKEDAAKSIAELELERQTIRHREVLSKLLPTIERHVADAVWCKKAMSLKPSLNPRAITEKEKDLFNEVIGETYRQCLQDECKQLDCALPIKLHTAGQKGKTVRQLSMTSGHPPEDILSEGEQKAVALADFLTEVGLNPANAGIILDDPVNSQDHERKRLIATRLVEEARKRQVVVFTHDLPFLNQIIPIAEDGGVAVTAHWVERDSSGRPGHVALDDVPAKSKAYDTVERARQLLAEAQKVTGSVRQTAIMSGMGALRRTIEECIVKRLFKGVVPRWEDRVIVTALRTIAWDESLADELVDKFEELSAYIEGHSHTPEAMGAPPEIRDLEDKIKEVEALIGRAKAARQKKKLAPPAEAVPKPAKV